MSEGVELVVFFFVLRIIVIVLLLVGTQSLSNDFYILLRYFVTAVSAYGAYTSYQLKQQNWIWIFGFIAIIFNPFLPLPLTKSSWVIIDLIATGIFLTSLIYVQYRFEVFTNYKNEKFTDAKDSLESLKQKIRQTNFEKTFKRIGIICGLLLLFYIIRFNGGLQGFPFPFDRGIYIGSVSHGKPYGQGRLIRITGSVYEGEFSNGLFHGYGKFILRDGLIYDGFWNEGEFYSGEIINGEKVMRIR